ncbi:hypothetical protein [Rhodococcus tibetensis]|uniref:Uncharacterized protein n=1 Tax=Rhodococcus tibetensis TaxID=2965064 RepID=A0ABT1QE77_9NOCA|nr:hypothetical protein [Rhodococcus sp. FXJ9.536]MCQ4120571.1 hypothetical protein [Rhodococcus sp. FXJ9.536]
MTFASRLVPSRAAPALAFVEDTVRKAASASEQPIRVVVCTVTVPIEVAKTSFRILRLTEELLAEVVFLLRTMRPVVEATTQQADNLDSVFRTFEQIQSSADAIARTPIGVVRNVFAPARSPRDESAPRPTVIEAEAPPSPPGLAVRIPSITVTAPRITFGKPSR